MHCTQCGLWELGVGDLVCSWCGASYLHFTVSVQPAQLSIEDYPPPIELSICNESPMGAITVERLESSHSWITLLPDQFLPQAIAPGAEQTFLVDVDTFAAGNECQAVLAVNVLHAPEAATAVLHLQQPRPSGS